MKRYSFAFAQTGALLVVSFAVASGCSGNGAHRVGAGEAEVGVSYAQSSQPFRDLPEIEADEASEATHAPLRPFAGRGICRASLRRCAIRCCRRRYRLSRCRARC